MTKILIQIHRIVSRVFLILTIVLFFIMLLFQKDVALGYELVWLMPLSFFICLLLIIFDNNEKYNLTRLCFELYSFIRYVLIPVLSSITGIYNGTSYLTSKAEYIVTSILLMCVELVAGTLFLLFIPKFRFFKFDSSERSITIEGNRFIYMLFLGLALLLYITIGRPNHLVQFGVVSSADSFEDISGSFLTLVRQIIKIALFLMFLLVTDNCKRKYDNNPQKVYFFIPLLFGVINIVTIVGQRRSEQLNMSIMVLIILLEVFPKYKKTMIVGIVSIFVVMMMYLTLYKNFRQYGIDVSVKSGFSLEFIVKNLQAYFGGIQNMAETVLFKKNVSPGFGNFVYDIFRSIFGLNALFKGKNTMTIELFNTMIYGTNTSNGHVLSSTGYSYVFFGILFPYICLFFNLFISLLCEKKIMNTNSYEMLYISLYIFSRFAMNLYAFSIPLINYSTMILGTIGLLYFVSSHAQLSKK